MGVRAWGREVAGLVLPVQCAGCGLDDVAWCDACRAPFRRDLRRCEDRAGRLDLLDGNPLPVWTLADCGGPVREAIVAWKDRGRYDLTPALADVVGAGARALAQALAPTLGPGFGPPLLVVAAPSTSAARRRRGGNLVDALARAVADGLTTGGCPARAESVLTRRGADQAGLGARARGLNLAGRVGLRSSGHASVDGSRVLVVDDVLTTGATIAACRAALADARATVVGAITLASTPPPGRRAGSADSQDALSAGGWSLGPVRG